MAASNGLVQFGQAQNDIFGAAAGAPFQQDPVQKDLVAYTKASLASRIGKRGQDVEASLRHLRNSLTAEWQRLVTAVPEGNTARPKRLCLQQMLKITEYPMTLNTGTSNSAGNKFNMDVELVVKIPEGINAVVEVYAISLPLFGRLTQLEAQKSCTGNRCPPDSAWLVKELEENALENCETGKAQAIKISLPKPKIARGHKAESVDKFCRLQQWPDDRIIAKFVNVSLDNIPFSPIQDNIGSDGNDPPSKKSSTEKSPSKTRSKWNPFSKDKRKRSGQEENDDNVGSPSPESESQDEEAKGSDCRFFAMLSSKNQKRAENRPPNSIMSEMAELESAPVPESPTERNDRRATACYYLVAVANLGQELGYVNAFSLPVCIVCNTSQRWQAASAMFWHDSCRLQRLEQGYDQMLANLVPEHENQELSVQFFKQCISWYFDKLIGGAEKLNKPYFLTEGSLPEDSLEFLVRKVLGVDCAQLDHFSESTRPDACHCYTGGVNDLQINEMLTTVSWKQFFCPRKSSNGKFAQWFFDTCQFIRFLEENALEVKRANEKLGNGSPDSSSGNSSGEEMPDFNITEKGLWDNGLIRLLSKKQVAIYLSSVYRDFPADRNLRPLLLRISESAAKSISIYSISNAGLIVAMEPRRQAKFESLPLPQCLYENNDLRQAGIRKIYPSIDIGIFKQWCPLPKSGNNSNDRNTAETKQDGAPRSSGYVKSKQQMDCREFIEVLQDSAVTLANGHANYTGFGNEDNNQRRSSGYDYPPHPHPQGHSYSQPVMPQVPTVEALQPLSQSLGSCTCFPGNSQDSIFVCRAHFEDYRDNRRPSWGSSGYSTSPVRSPNCANGPVSPNNANFEPSATQSNGQFHGSSDNLRLELRDLHLVPSTVAQNGNHPDNLQPVQAVAIADVDDFDPLIGFDDPEFIANVDDLDTPQVDQDGQLRFQFPYQNYHQQNGYTNNERPTYQHL